MAQYNRPPLQNLYGARIDRSSRQEKRENRKNDKRVQGIIDSVEEESVTRRAQSISSIDFASYDELELRALASYLEQPNAVAYLDGRQVPLERAHDLPRDGHWHHVAIVRTTGRSPMATERWECVDPDGTIYREAQRTSQGFGAAGAMERYALMPNPSGFRPRSPPPINGPVTLEEMARMVQRAMTGAVSIDLAGGPDRTATQTLDLERTHIGRRSPTGRQVRNYPVQSIGAGFLHLGGVADRVQDSMRAFADAVGMSFGEMTSSHLYPNPQSVAKGKAVTPPHPDAGKVIRRPLRSLAGIMVEDVRQADGSVARRVRRDEGK